MEFKVGAKFTKLSAQPEGTIFEITESGPIWFFNYASPTDKEISDMSEGCPFEIRALLTENILWIFAKCGDQEWAEAPYNPHLSTFPVLSPLPDNGSGYALTLVMLDAATQIIRHIRVIGLGNRFSRQLEKDVDELLCRPFTRAEYDLAIRKTQARYSTAQMVKMCRNYWRLR